MRCSFRFIRSDSIILLFPISLSYDLGDFFYPGSHSQLCGLITVDIVTWSLFPLLYWRIFHLNLENNEFKSNSTLWQSLSIIFPSESSWGLYKIYYIHLIWHRYALLYWYLLPLLGLIQSLISCSLFPPTHKEYYLILLLLSHYLGVVFFLGYSPNLTICLSIPTLWQISFLGNITLKP